MRAERFIADKLRFKGRLATVAISVSFFVMILSMAIAAGFRSEIRTNISEISGDIQLSGSSEPMDTRPSYCDKLEAVAGLRSITPVIWKPGIVKGADDICGVMVKGIPMPDSCSMQASIPRELAKRMKLNVGNPVTTWFIDDKARARRFTVSDIYDGIIDSDGALIMKVPLSDMQRLCGWEADQASALEIMVVPEISDGWMLQSKASELNRLSYDSHGEEEDILHASTTRDRYAQIYDWLDLIDFNVLTILLLMTVVAGFNMISGLLILLFRHISTIGMLKSMGMSNIRSSSAALHCRITDFGDPTNPSSSATIARVKYRHRADAGISRKASVSTMDFANILFSAIRTVPSHHRCRRQTDHT